MEYFLTYSLFVLCSFLGLCIYGRIVGDPIGEWNSDGWVAVLFISFIPLIGTAFIIAATLGPALLKERTFKKTYEKDSVLKGIEDDATDIR